MLKMAGSLFILLGGLWARRVHLAEARRRRDLRSDLLRALRRLGEAVRLTRMPLPALLERLASDCGPEAAAFLQGVGASVRKGESLVEAWRRLAEDLPLPPEEKALLSALGEDLQGDEEQVCKALSLAAMDLADRAGEAERRRPEEEKRATALWLSAAALLVILLI